MHLEIGGQDYLDGSVSIEELTSFYDRTGKVPKTAGVSPYQYEVIFGKIKDENPDAVILHLCYSAKLSCGYQNSIIADDGSIPVYRADIKNVSMGQAFIVMKTAELIEKQPGIEPEELVARVEAITAKTRFSFVPGNLDYLRAGGRVSNAQYLGAKILRLKPLIEVKDGLMISTKKYRGSNKEIISRMLSDFFAGYSLDKSEIYFGYACSIDSVTQRDMEKQAAEAGIRNVVWLKAGGVITAHSGPGGIGVAGMELQ